MSDNNVNAGMEQNQAATASSEAATASSEAATASSEAASSSISINCKKEAPAPGVPGPEHESMSGATPGMSNLTTPTVNTNENLMKLMLESMNRMENAFVSLGDKIKPAGSEAGDVRTSRKRRRSYRSFSEYLSDQTDVSDDSSSISIHPPNTFDDGEQHPPYEETDTRSIAEKSDIQALFCNTSNITNRPGHKHAMPSESGTADHVTNRSRLGQSSKLSSNSSKWLLSKEPESGPSNLQIDEDILQEITEERALPQKLGPPISSHLAEVVKNCWTHKSTDIGVTNQLIKTIKIPENLADWQVPSLNEAILKNKQVHPFYKRNDKKMHYMQELVLKAATTVARIADITLEADRNSQMVDSKALVANAIDTITLLGKANSQINSDRKSGIKPALNEDIRSLCDKDHTSPYLLGDNLEDSVKEARQTYRLENTLANKSHYSQKPNYSYTTTRGGYKQAPNYSHTRGGYKQAPSYSHTRGGYKQAPNYHHPGAESGQNLNYRGRKKNFNSNPYTKNIKRNFHPIQQGVQQQVMPEKWECPPNT